MASVSKNGGATQVVQLHLGFVFEDMMNKLPNDVQREVLDSLASGHNSLIRKNIIDLLMGYGCDMMLRQDVDKEDMHVVRAQVSGITSLFTTIQKTVHDYVSGKHPLSRPVEQAEQELNVAEQAQAQNKTPPGEPLSGLETSS